MRLEATAQAPATVGNVAVGFDLLGLALQGPHDVVRVRRIDAPEVRLGDVQGCVTSLPDDPSQNTATAGLVALREARGLPWGFEVSINKGIALGSGMGGSAASAAASVVAASALLDAPLSHEELVRFGLVGESVASGSQHADNLAPCLFGGLQLVLGHGAQTRALALPVPTGLRCVLVHPHARLDTRTARAVLQRPFDLGDFTAQSAALAGFLVACHRDDHALLAASLHDVLIEPLRAPLVPGFEAVKAAALAHGALGCSISGAGPSVFAWCLADHAVAARDAMVNAFKAAANLDADAFISPLNAPGTTLLP